MRIAVGIVSLFPGGGLQRDCVEISNMMHHFGHEVVVYTARLTHAIDNADVPIVVIPNDARTNHRRQYQFAVDFLRQTSNRFDLIVGFDKLIGLDVLYCADRSMRYRLRKQLHLRLLPRYRVYRDLEGDSFKPRQKTRLILLSQRQWVEYLSVWRTERGRIAELPPTLSPARRKPEYRVDGIRNRTRMQLGLAAKTWVWLSIGVQPKTKGFDRVVRALHHFPEATLLIAGLDGTEDAAQQTAELAQRLGVSSRLIWLGHREDIENIATASDVLMHPARYDTTGTVILEALVNGLPVITTSASGYAKHVEAAGGGLVLDEPFDFLSFLTATAEMSDPTRRATYSQAGIAYGQNKGLYEGRMLAAQMIINLAVSKRRNVSESDILWSAPLDGRLRNGDALATQQQTCVRRGSGRIT